jgi:CDP-diacylglycerol--glycerol-3-phosphate 3-phosphatidyltransferase
MVARHLPNLITLIRLLLAVAVFACLSRALALPSGSAVVTPMLSWAFWLWLVAAVSDTLDGYLARKYGWVTPLGRIADPVVDKVLTLGVLAYFVPGQHLYGRAGDLLPVMPVWALVVLLTREFLVTALRGYVESRGLAFPAERSGKWKMAVQSIFIGVVIGSAAGAVDPLRLGWLAELLRHPWSLAALFWAMIALTAASGVSYCLRATRMLAGAGA